MPESLGGARKSKFGTRSPATLWYAIPSLLCAYEHASDKGQIEETGWDQGRVGAGGWFVGFMGDEVGSAPPRTERIALGVT